MFFCAFSHFSDCSSATVSSRFVKRPDFKRIPQLTEAGVDEAVPAAAAAPQQPPPADAGREAESGSEQAHQHVADADVQQQHVHRRAQLLEFAEEQQDDKVVEEAEGHDEAQNHGQHDEARRGQLPPGRRRVQQLPVIAQVEAVIQTSLTGKHAALHSSEPGSTFGVGHFSHLWSFSGAPRTLLFLWVHAHSHINHHDHLHLGGGGLLFTPFTPVSHSHSQAAVCS